MLELFSAKEKGLTKVQGLGLFRPEVVLEEVGRRDDVGLFEGNLRALQLLVKWEKGRANGIQFGLRS